MATDPGFFSLVEKNATKNPAKTLIAVEGESLSYGEFTTATDRVCRGLSALGVAPGMKVALIIPNSTIWYIIYWGIVKTGALPVPLDPLAGEWEIARLLGLAECETCFAAAHYKHNPIFENLRNARARLPRLRQVIAATPEAVDDPDKDILSFAALGAMGEETGAAPHPHQPRPGDALMLACTSGSTGNPKIIVVPYIGFFTSQKDMADYLGFRDNDRMLLGMPLYHQGGFGMGLQMVFNGGSVRYQTTFDPADLLASIERERITVVQLTSTLAKLLLSCPEFDTFDISSVRLCYFAGEMLPMEIAREFFDRRGIRVVDVIGASETGTMVVWDSDFDRDVDSNEFRALRFTRFLVLDDQKNEVGEGRTGTLCVNTDAQLLRYFGNDVETGRRLFTKAGRTWFDTGDLGLRTAGGRVRFAGRSKRIIKRGSNLVCPEENEAFLLTHPAVAAVAVIGEPHELFGEMIVAYIQPAPGCALKRADIVSFCKGKLSAYKIPDKMIFTDSIPHDIGKIQFKYIHNISGSEPDGP